MSLEEKYRQILARCRMLGIEETYAESYVILFGENALKWFIEDYADEKNRHNFRKK